MRLIVGNVQGPANPILRALWLIGGAVLLLCAAVFGAVVLTVVIGFVMIAAAIAFVRIWWIRRKLEQAAAGSQFRASTHTQADPGRPAGGQVIEGEFTEVNDNASDRHDTQD
jgi:UPF0716 family protein affecting phage T7 exclusion